MRLTVISHSCVTDVNQQVYAEMEKLGHDITIICPSNLKTDYGNGVNPINRWPDFHGQLITLPVRGQFHLQTHVYASGLNAAIRKSAPDFMYIEEEPYALVTGQASLIARNQGIPFAVYSCQNLNKRRDITLARVLHGTMGRPLGLIAITPSVEQVWAPYFNRTQVVPLTVDTNLFRPGINQRNKWRNDIGIPLDAVVLGFIGRFVKEKGILRFLDVYRNLSKQDDRIYAVVVGDGPLKSSIESAAVGMKVLLPGYVPHREMSQWMAGWDILVLPSESTGGWTEQFGRVIVEAAACGIPTVGSTSGEIPRLVHELRGWVFEEGNDAGFLLALQQAVAKVRQNPVSWGSIRRIVEEKYSKQAQDRLLSDTFLLWKQEGGGLHQDHG